MQTRRQELRLALVWAAVSYIPLVMVIHTIDDRDLARAMRGIGLPGGAWTLASLGTCVVVCMLIVDVVLPIGRSKIGHVRALSKAFRRTHTGSTRMPPEG